MGRIKDTELYALDSYLTLDDYVIGSDAENLGKTQNYGLRGIFDTFRNTLNLTSIEYTFSDGTDPELDQTDSGYFTSNNILAGAITSLYVNKQTLSGGNISSLVDVVAQNVSSFILRLYQPSAAGQVFFFVIDTIIDNGTYYTFNVENFVGGNTLVDSTTYGVAFDLAGVPSIVNETDPIFMASPAAGITAPKIINWDAAFGWGDHSLVGYLTTETDPVFSASAASGIIGTQITNWDAAFGWGDHATVGYLTSETDPTVPSYVKTILVSDITNWNFAYGWGDHSLAGYITSESDPVFSASAAAGITPTQVNNWNSAYGWGNHALFGYLREINIDTLAELNGIVTDATLITDAPSDGTIYGRQNAAWVEVSAANIYTDNGSLTGARTVNLNGNELIFNNGATNIYFNNGRIGTGSINPWFSGSQITNEPFDLQSVGIATYTILLKEAGAVQSDGTQGVSIFTSLVSGGASDGYVTSIKNFKDDVQVISMSGVGNADYTSGLREVETTFGLRNDYTAGQFGVFDTFNNDYPSGTSPEVRQAQGWVAIHGGGAAAKKIGMWRYDTTTYTSIFEVSPSNVWTFGVDVNVPDEAYGIGWNGSTEVPTKNAIYDKIETIGGSSTWGGITGTLSAQTDLQGELDAKVDLAGDTMTGQLTVPDIFTIQSDIAADTRAIDFRTASNEDQSIRIRHEVGDGSLLEAGYAIIIESQNGVPNDDAHLEVEGNIYAQGSKVWHAGNDGSGSGLDADTLRTFVPTTANTASTIVLRDASSVIQANSIITNTNAADQNLLVFSTERPWQFMQGNTGASTTLDLIEDTGTKSFRIGNSTTRDEITFNSGTGDIVSKGQYIGTGGYLSVKNTGLTHVANVGTSGSTNQYLFGGSSTGSTNSMDTFLRVRRVVDGGLLYQDTTAGGTSYGLIDTSSTAQTKSGALTTNGNILCSKTTARITAQQDGSRLTRIEGNTSGGAIVMSNASGTDAVLRGYGNSDFSNTVTATNFILSSDRNLKENIMAHNVEPIEINLKWFNWKQDKGQGRYQLGAIAQELEVKHPEFVITNDEGVKSVAYIDLLLAKNAELEKRIERLENLINQQMRLN